MYEYKVESYGIFAAERSMNLMAAEGWRVISVMPYADNNMLMVVVYERGPATSRT